MSSFDDRKTASESKFTMDAQTQFKIEARRNKKLALWAAELLGLKDDAVDKYVTAVIAADFEEAGDDDVFRKLKADFAASNVDMSDAGIRSKMGAMLAEARQELT